MERQLTATAAKLEIDRNEIRARQYAAMFIHELRDYIPEAVVGHARHRLARLFMEQEVEITTAQERRLAKLPQG
jgi:hypothetical protein